MFYAQLFGMKHEDARKKAEKWVDFVGLGGKANRNKRISEFSKGMRQRVGIAQSLVNDPKLLFYDEPTSGLDAIARRDIRDLMLELKSQGRAMFLSSHQLEDVEAVCHRVSIIHNGKLRVIGSVGELLQGERVEIRVSGISSDLASKLKAIAPDAIVVEQRTVFTEKNDPDAILAIMDLVRNNGGRIEAIVPKRRTLEDLFVEIVGERIVIGDGGTAFTASDAFPSVASSSRGDGIAASDRPNGHGNGKDDVAYTDAFKRAEPAVAETDETSTDAAGADASATTKTRRPGANKYKELNGK
jgi:ABC-2 type transport system ATP-binding protein